MLHRWPGAPKPGVGPGPTGCREEERDLQEEGGLVVVGADAVSLYPSLDTESTSESVRMEVIESKMKFEGVIMFEAGKYVAMNTQPWERRQMGVDHMVPNRRYRMGLDPGITGDGATSRQTEDDKQWVRKRD